MVEVEICVDSLQSAFNAYIGGCTRLELCSALSEGGLTPTPALLRAVKQAVNIPVFCMIRCRGGPMVYSDEEMNVMIREAEDLIEAGADGLVFGAVTVDGDVDKLNCDTVRNIAHSLPCTFHRAFDVIRDPTEALKTVIELKYDRILTSGGCPTALLGKDLISVLVKNSGSRMKIMAGSGVNSSNVAELIKSTKVTCVHGSARVLRSYPEYNFRSLNMGQVDDRVRYITDESEVHKLVAAASQAFEKL